MCIVPGFSRETESIGSVYVQKEIHVEELAPVIMETGEPTSAPQGQAVARRADSAVLVPCTGSPRDPEKWWCRWRQKAGRWRIPSYLGRIGFLVLSRPSSDWIGTHQHYGGQSTLLIKMLILTENTLAETPRIMFDEISMHFMTCKLNNHHMHRPQFIILLSAGIGLLFFSFLTHRSTVVMNLFCKGLLVHSISLRFI